MQTTVFRIYSFFRKGLTVLGNFGFRKQYGSENMKCTPRFLEYTVFHQSKVLEKKQFLEINNFLKTRFLEIAVFQKSQASEKNSFQKTWFWEIMVFQKSQVLDGKKSFQKTRFLEITVFRNYGFGKNTFFVNCSFRKKYRAEIMKCGPRS